MLKILYKSHGKVSVRIVLIIIILSCTAVVNAQKDKKYIRQGNREYSKKDYSQSEVSYRKAIDKNNQSPNAVFNIGDALYKQKKYEDAGNQFMESASQNENKTKKAEGLYNLGNSLLQSKKIQESIDAYKNSLRLDLGNMKAKYNLAYAQDLLQQQQQQKQNKQQSQQDKNDKNKDDKQKQKEDQNDNNKDQKNNQQKDQNNQDTKNQQAQPQQISKEDAERLLNALANDEKKVQKKVKLAQAAKEQVKTVKNW